MVMNRVFVITLLTCSILACSKEDEITPDNRGTIRYTNQSYNPYYIYFDGQSVGTVPARSGYDKTDAKEGIHSVKAVQVSGYVLYPTVVESNVSVTKDKSVIFLFP
jgi:hypothetical protein